MLGAIVGDIVGSVYEWDNIEAQALFALKGRLRRREAGGENRRRNHF